MKYIKLKYHRTMASLAQKLGSLSKELAHDLRYAQILALAEEKEKTVCEDTATVALPVAAHRARCCV